MQNNDFGEKTLISYNPRQNHHRRRNRTDCPLHLRHRSHHRKNHQGFRRLQSRLEIHHQNHRCHHRNHRLHRNNRIRSHLMH